MRVTFGCIGGDVGIGSGVYDGREEGDNGEGCGNDSGSIYTAALHYTSYCSTVLSPISTGC